MKIKLQAPQFLIHYTGEGKSTIPQSKMWDGKSLLTLGHPARFVLQRNEDQIVVRDFSNTSGKKTDLLKIALNHANFGKPLMLSPLAADRITISALTALAPVHMGRVQQIRPQAVSAKHEAVAEDKLFNKYLKHLLGATAACLIAIMLFKPAEPETANEELIPKKFAKVILSKPKEKMKEPSASAAAASQAQVKAVSRAMQSKTVQKSISNILKGGLTKYSIMSTGKSIQSLTQKTQGAVAMAGNNLQNKASDLIAGSHVGSNQIGSDTGYGAGQGTAVKGQGVGQLEIGLNTNEASVDEGLTKEEVARVIHAHMSEIRYCYESAILKDATLAGKVAIDFKIGPNGVVNSSNITESSIADRGVGNCLAGKLRTWKFPQPRGGVTVAVSYPFIFKSLSR